jgi:two-component system response regulator NreC
MTIRVLVADDHNIVREGFRSLIDAEKGMEVIGEAGDGRTAVEMARKLVPDVVILDVRMPVLNGIEAARQITAEHRKIEVVGLSMHLEKQYILEMLKAGASGYLAKDCPSGELIKAIRTVARGEVHLSHAAAAKLVEGLTGTDDHPRSTVFTKLTEREREVLQLLAEGHSVKEAADRLNLSVNTLHTHRKHIMEKLDIHNIAGLTKYAIREGITEL